MAEAPRKVALLARLARLKAVAQAASGDEQQTLPLGEHWHWECPYDDAPINAAEQMEQHNELLKCPQCGRIGGDLRSVEEYEDIGYVLPSFIVQDAVEIRPSVGLFLATWHPAMIIALITATEETLHRHAFCMWCMQYGICKDIEAIASWVNLVED